MIRNVFLTAVIGCSLATGGVANAAAPCVTAPEAESITLVAMPEIIRQVGQICATALPASSLVRQTSGPFIAKYQAAANQAWPAARTALGRVGGPQVQGFLQSEFTRPLLASLLAPALIGTVQVKDCPRIDRIATLMQPLPARNTAGLIVAGLQFAKEKTGQSGSKQALDIPICTADRR